MMCRPMFVPNIEDSEHTVVATDTTLLQTFMRIDLMQTAAESAHYL